MTTVDTEQGKNTHSNIITRLSVLTLLLILVSCVGVPFDYPKSPSSAIATSPETSLGKTRQQWQQDHGDLNGFVALSSGINALGARLKMIKNAEQSIDAQYFIVKKDEAGILFVGKLLLAADRGVRVRLLVDDIFSPGIDQPFSLLNSHPNIEVRLFNPLSRQSLKAWSYLVDFRRANRRMHNKSFTVDNSMSIVGGRNIGEEYFELKQDVKFDDFEVFTMGPIVSDVNAGFDEFWNSSLSVPMEAFEVKIDPSRLDDWRTIINSRTEEDDEGIYTRAVNSTFIQSINSGEIQPAIAHATMVTDSPEKLLSRVGDREVTTLANEIGQRFRAADSEILIISPYFIPQKTGTELIETLLAKGIRVIIVTNSLASTNHVAVHSGYSRYRKRLLQAGAEIYEIRARGTNEESEWGTKPEMVTLHSKVTIVDRKSIFVGSLNFDPRSVLINTEMGLFVESAEIGEMFAQTILDELPRVTYRVDLDDRGKLCWIYDFDRKVEVENREPQSTWGRRFKVGIYRFLPIESQL
jgi:putative cardiolipin synthase